MVATQLLTAEDLEAMGEAAEKRFELIDGLLHEVEGVGGRHGEIEFGLGGEFWAYRRRHRVGTFFTSDTRFIVKRDPDVVPMADVAFVRADRIPDTGVWEGMVPIAPDLVVEIASPNDTVADVRKKATRWLDAGVEIVWVLWPRRRAVSILRAGQLEVVLNADDILDGGSILPGFSVPVAAIFAD